MFYWCFIRIHRLLQLMTGFCLMIPSTRKCVFYVDILHNDLDYTDVLSKVCHKKTFPHSSPEGGDVSSNMRLKLGELDLVRVSFTNTTSANEPVLRLTWLAIKMLTHCNITAAPLTLCQPLQANMLTHNINNRC